jgi:hypothetical protein
MCFRRMLTRRLYLGLCLRRLDSSEEESDEVDAEGDEESKSQVGNGK